MKLISFIILACLAYEEQGSGVNYDQGTVFKAAICSRDKLKHKLKLIHMTSIPHHNIQQRIRERQT